MAPEAHPLHILFFPLMAPGHTLPMVDMAKLFASHGVKATFLTTPANAPPVQAAVDLANRFYQHPIRLHLIPFPSAAVGLPGGCENLSSVSFDQQTSFLTGVNMLQEPFRRVLLQLRPDAVVTDTFLPWTLSVSEELNLPRLVFHGMSFFTLCAMQSLHGKQQLSPDGETVIIPNFPRRVELLRSQVPDPVKSGPAFAEIFAQVARLESRSYGVVVNSFYELEPEFADHYWNFHKRKAWHIGPLSLCNKQEEDRSRRGGDLSAMDQHECIKWLDEKEPNSVLYVNFGSLSSVAEAQFRELALGLEACGHPFLWVVRNCRDEWWPQGYTERVEGRCMVLKGWAPQLSILEHMAVGGFLTHCGWNSILEAVSAGVPMVTWPFFADQFFNERLIVEALGAGMALGAKQYTLQAAERPVMAAAEIETAMRRLMDEEEGERMRRRATELALTAKRAVEEGGSSYVDVGNLIRELMERRSVAKPV